MASDSSSSAGASSKTEKQAERPLRYVILRHEGIDSPHYDLMFETAPGSALATWRSDIWPITAATPLTQLGDHRRAYLDYEGPLSDDRGFVRRVEAGALRTEIDPVSRDHDLFLPGGALRITRRGEQWFALPG